MPNLYEKWMYAWETRLTTRDTNRVVLYSGDERGRAWHAALALAVLAAEQALPAGVAP